MTGSQYRKRLEHIKGTRLLLATHEPVDPVEDEPIS